MHTLRHKHWTPTHTSPPSGDVPKLILTSKLQLPLTFPLNTANNMDTVVPLHFTSITSFSFSCRQHYTHSRTHTRTHKQAPCSTQGALSFCQVQSHWSFPADWIVPWCQKICLFSSSGAARFTSDVSQSQNHFVLPLRGWGCKLPENNSNMINLAPRVLEDILSQSAKAAKLIHNPLWCFNSHTWQEKEKREDGAATKRKGWTMKHR